MEVDADVDLTLSGDSPEVPARVPDPARPYRCRYCPRTYASTKERNRHESHDCSLGEL